MSSAQQANPARPVEEDDDDIFVSPEEGRRMFDAAVRRRMGISGDEFIRRWDSGEFKAIADIADADGNRHIMDLYFLMPFGRSDT